MSAGADEPALAAGRVGEGEGLALQAVQVLPILAIGLAIGGARSFRFLTARRAGAV